MSDWEDLRHLLALARFGTLTAASQALDVEHATVARRIAKLETETSLKLVDRRGRRLTLTADGDQMVRIAQKMETEALAIDRLKSNVEAHVSGTVVISAPPAYAAEILMPKFAEFQRSQPAIVLQIHGENRQASLDRREADIAIRLSRPEKGDLTVSQIGSMTFRYYATATYLADIAPASWRFIAYDDGMDELPQQQELLQFAGSRPIVFRANNSELQRSMACSGGGIAILPDFMARSTDLVEVFPGEIALSRKIWLVIHSDLKTNSAVRAVVGALRGRALPTTSA